MDDAPKATAQDVLATLQSIDSSLKALVRHFGAGIVHGATGAPAGASSAFVPAVASDRDLDGQYGNPEIKTKSPRDWTGDDMKGKRLSECPPEYLDLTASRLDYFAEQNRAEAEDQQTPPEQVGELLKKAKYNRIDASRHRGWAVRLRAGWTPPVEAAFGTPAADAPLAADEIPFSFILALLASVPVFYSVLC